MPLIDSHISGNIYGAIDFFLCYMTKKDDYIENQLANLGRRIREVRKEREYANYEQFAFDNELPRAQYGRYEKGHDLRFSSLLKVLKAMNISLKDFFSKGF